MSVKIERLEPGWPDWLPSLLNAANEAPLDLAMVGREKLFGAGRSGDPLTWLATVDSEPAGIATVCGHFLRVLAVDRRFRRRGAGSALLATAESHMRDERRTSISVGAESGNYFVPGVTESDAGTLAFFERNGYVGLGVAVHLEVDLPRPPQPSPTGVEIVDAVPGEREELAAFIRSEFAEAWAFEVDRGFDTASPPVVLARRNGCIVGFAGYELNNQGLGTFGPAGVSAAERHSGTGRALLLAALNRLSAQGYPRAVIQWAAALPFYEKSADARVMARFQLLSRTLQ